jgi:hypothetical protein
MTDGKKSHVANDDPNRSLYSASGLLTPGLVTMVAERRDLSWPLMFDRVGERRKEGFTVKAAGQG